MELGLYTFGDITPDPHTGRAPSVPERYAEILAAAKLADAAGLDVFGVGEHHRLDIPIASPAVLMAAIAGGTSRIRLTSAVTILPTLDPVRVFQDFATADLASGGRAEIIAGRGGFTESFTLFGEDIADFDALFAEKLDLLLRLNGSEPVTWRGRTRPPLAEAVVPPRPARPLPIWIGVGGTLASALRAGDLGMPLTIANISKPPAELAPQITAYRQRAAEKRHDPKSLRVALATHLYVAPNSQDAADEFYPYYSGYFASHAPKTAYAAEIPREVYDRRIGQGGPTFVGSPQQIIDKLMAERELFGNDRFLAQIDLGGMPYAKVAAGIELLATKVLPAVKDL